MEKRDHFSCPFFHGLTIDLNRQRRGPGAGFTVNVTFNLQTLNSYDMFLRLKTGPVVHPRR